MPRYRFDDYLVDTAAFSVQRAGSPVPLEPKAFDLLVLLLETPGRVVTKPEILGTVWRDTAVTDNALTRIVAHLRKSLDDDARDARYVETIPTRGYRFVAPVSRDPEPPATPAPSPPAAHHRPGRWRAALAAVVAAGATAAAVGVTRRVVGRAEGPPSIESLWPAQATVSPGLDTFPALAPGGAALAYASDRTGGFEIVVKSLVPGATEVALTSDGRQNVQPTWSPDGEHVAYHSMRQGGIWIVPARGGVPRQVADFGSAPAWSPDGARLAFQSDPLADVAPSASAANAPSTIWTVARDGTDLRRLTAPTDPAGGHGSPAWSPDGRRIVFTAYSYRPSSLWSVPASGGPARLVAEGHVSMHDPVFAPGGRALYYATGGPFIVRVPLSADTGLPDGEPVALSTPGIQAARYLSISGDGRRLALSGLALRSDLWSVPIVPDSGGPAGPAEALTDDTSRRKSTPVFSPDGEWIAYNGSRSGSGSDIWLLRARDGRIQPLTTGDPAESKHYGSNFRPSWFPDSRRVAFLASEGGRTTYRTADLDTRRPQPLMAIHPADVDGRGVRSGFNAAVDVRLSPDGREVAFSELDPDTGLPRIRVVAVADGASRTLGPADRAESYPAWSPDGRWIATELHTERGSEVGVRPAAGGPLRVLTRGGGESWVHGWSPDGDRVVFAALREGVWNIAWVSRTTGLEVQVTRHSGAAGFVRYPTWSPRGDRIVYERGEVRGNVWIAPLPSPGGGRGMRLHR